MKKARKPAGPSPGDLREMPEVDFTAHRVRTNPFVKRLAREGITIVAGRPSPGRPATGREPSRSALLEMPEVDLARARPRSNLYAKRIATAGITLRIGRGRPPRGAEVGPTVPKSIRLPREVWRRLAERARRNGIPLHAALRAAVLEWLNRVA